MIAWSVRSDAPVGEVASGAADGYTPAVEAMLDTVRTDLLTRERGVGACPARYVLCLDGDQVAVLAVGVGADCRPDRAGALEHLERIEQALTGGGRGGAGPGSG